MRFLVVATIAVLAFLAPSEAVSVSDKLRSLSTRIAGEAAELSQAATLYDDDADLLQINSAEDDDTDLLQINSADDDDTDLLQITSADDDDDADLLQINSAATSDSNPSKPKSKSKCHDYADIANCHHHHGCAWSHILRVKHGKTIKTLKDPHGHCAPRPRKHRRQPGHKNPVHAKPHEQVLVKQGKQ